MSVFDTARDTDRAIERMATALPSAVLLCLLLHSSRGSLHLADIHDYHFAAHAAPVHVRWLGVSISYMQLQI